MAPPPPARSLPSETGSNCQLAAFDEMYSVTSGPALLAAQRELDASDPFPMGMARTDCLYDISDKLCQELMDELGLEQRKAKAELDASDPFSMGMARTDCIYAVNTLRRLYQRLPASAMGSAAGTEQLMLLQKLPDAYPHKQAQLNKYYDGECAGVPAWNINVLARSFPHRLDAQCVPAAGLMV
jgi:hypothetical protein